MFNYPGTELFRAEERRVVWSIEEFEAALSEGWSEDKAAEPAEPAASAEPAKKTAKK